MNICDSCGALMVRETRKETFTYKGESIELDQPGWYCCFCNNSEFSLKDIEKTDPQFLEFVLKVNRKKGSKDSVLLEKKRK